MTTKRTAKKARNLILLENLEEGARIMMRLRQTVMGQMKIINTLRLELNAAIESRDIARRSAVTLEQQCAQQVTVLRTAHEALRLDLGKGLARMDIEDALATADGTVAA